MSISTPRHHHEFIQLIVLARDHLHAMKSGPSPPDPSPSSLVPLAFDPHVGRQLQMATPIRIVTPPPFEDTCKAMERFLDGLFDVCLLSSSEQLSTWQVWNFLSSAFLWHLPEVRVASVRQWLICRLGRQALPYECHMCGL